MVTNLELKYRSLDQLIDTCSTDLRSIYSDGFIEIAELIKVAQDCNYKLGLQINQVKETILEIEHGRCKLPNDFMFLNFALLCQHHTEVIPSIANGLVTQEEVIYHNPPNFASNCFCFNVKYFDISTSNSYPLPIVDCNGQSRTIVIPNAQTSGTTFCAQSVISPVPATVTVVQGANCYNTTDGGFSCTNTGDCSCADKPDTCTTDRDPWNQNTVRTICDGTVGIKIEQVCNNQVRHYTHFEPLYMQPCRTASAFSSNDQFCLAGNVGILRNGFLETHRRHHTDHNRLEHIDCTKVYINYEGLLESETGELLVLDHPAINPYYEYAIKRRIVENLYLNGEPDLERRLQRLDLQYLAAKQEAMNIAYMPDFQLVKATYATIRRQANETHFTPFSRFFGQQAVSAFFDRLVNGRYRQ